MGRLVSDIIIGGVQEILMWDDGADLWGWLDIFWWFLYFLNDVFMVALWGFSVFLFLFSNFPELSTSSGC